VLFVRVDVPGHAAMGEWFVPKLLVVATLLGFGKVAFRYFRAYGQKKRSPTNRRPPLCQSWGVIGNRSRASRRRMDESPFTPRFGDSRVRSGITRLQLT
jgi:hypothetical protein